MPDPPGPCSGQGEEPFPNAGREQSTDDCSQHGRQPDIHVHGSKVSAATDRPRQRARHVPDEMDGRGLSQPLADNIQSSQPGLTHVVRTAEEIAYANAAVATPERRRRGRAALGVMRMKSSRGRRLDSSRECNAIRRHQVRTG